MAFLRFCLVGSLGFLVDASITLALTQAAQLDANASRVLAFAAAATVTWQLNRTYTFESDAGGFSWLPYVVFTAIGALVNIGVYSWWLSQVPHSALNVLAAVAAGSVAALLFNFTVSRRWVFAPRSGRRAG